MLKRTRLSIGLMLSRVHFRRHRDAVVRFTDAITDARRALVILPETARDIAAVQWAMRYLADRFAGGSMVVMVRSELSPWVKNDKRYQLVTYRDEDVNLWYMPRRQLRRKLKTSTFDVALDLNLGFDLTGAYLCRESRAPLRIGFSKTHADRFYNFQIQTKATTSLTLAYRSYIRCLEMF